MNPDQEKTIREAWRNLDKHEPAEKMMRDQNLNYDDSGLIADYWLARMTLALSTQKEEIRMKMLKQIMPSNYVELPEHARAGAVFQDCLNIVEASK